MAHNAGVKVSATTPEITTATATVTANWRYNSPAMPPRKATGTNTAHSTSTIATTAPDTCSIALIAALVGDNFSSSIKRSIFSNTIIASSTTVPMDSTIAKSVSVLIENPNTHKPAKVPIKDIGTAIIGISVARQLCKNRYTTSTISTIASPSVLSTSQIDALTNKLVSYGTT